LPDISDKSFNLGEDITDDDEIEQIDEDEKPTKKRVIKKKAKGKGKTK
jgi:trehalose-6-phosphatase